MRNPYRLSTRSTGAVLAPARSSGTHGFSPDLPGIDAAFFALGPAIPKAQPLGRIDMRAIAPTIARMLGVALAAAEVKPLTW